MMASALANGPSFRDTRRFERQAIRRADQMQRLIQTLHAKIGDTIRVGQPLFDIVDPLTDETTTLASNTEGVFYMRRAIRFVTAGAPLGRVTGTRAFRTGCCWARD